jgi:hypothetical protein
MRVGAQMGIQGYQTDSVRVTVEPVELTLTADPTEVTVGDSVTFTASASPSSAALQVLGWSWVPDPAIAVASVRRRDENRPNLTVRSRASLSVSAGDTDPSTTCTPDSTTCVAPVRESGTMYVRALVNGVEKTDSAHVQIVDCPPIEPPIPLDAATVMCPKTPYESVCVDLWIEAETVNGLRGDGRPLDPDARPSESRVQIVVNTDDDTGYFYSISPTCTAVFDYCNQPLGPTHNQLTTTRQPNGDIVLDFHFSNSLTINPAIDGTVTLHPNGEGGYTASRDGNMFPSLAVFQWKDGVREEILYDPQTESTNLIDLKQRLRRWCEK